MRLGYPLPEAGGTAAAFYADFEWAIPDRYNIGEIIRDNGAAPEATAIHHVDTSGTEHILRYADLRSAVDAVAGGLAAADVGVGDRIACCLPTCPEQAVLHLAAYRRGAMSVPLSVLLGDQTIADALDRTDPQLLFLDEDVAEGSAAETFAGARSVHRFTPGPYEDGLAGGLRTFAREPVCEPVSTAPDDPALVVFTSGTTGAPKGVVLPHRYLAGSLPGYHCWFHLFDRQAARSARVWTPAEWAWAGALFDVVLPTLALGGTVVSRLRRRGFAPDAARSLVESTGVSHAFLPPTALAKMRQAHLQGPLDPLRIVMCGGESLSPALREWAESTLEVVINHGYGQTEANAVVGECAERYEPAPGAMGRPYPGHSVRVVDEHGEECDPGERGELLVELPDPVAFLRYWENPEETNHVLRGDALHTGDRAYWTEDGMLVHAGRMDDLIITSGYRVDPYEVEHVLAEHSGVTAAVVGGVPDEVRGERIKAVILPSEDQPADEAFRSDLRTFVADRLGAHKVPREIEYVDTLPETRTGKTDRSALF